MLSEIIKFYNKTADEIMTPRLDMEDIDIKTSFRTVVDFIIDPVIPYSGLCPIRRITSKGILYIKDLCRMWRSLTRSKLAELDPSGLFRA